MLRGAGGILNDDGTVTRGGASLAPAVDGNGRGLPRRRRPLALLASLQLLHLVLMALLQCRQLLLMDLPQLLFGLWLGRVLIFLLVPGL
jgi:hypothetical protein